LFYCCFDGFPGDVMVCFGMSDAPINLPDETEALKALVVSLQTELRAHSLVIQALRIQIARLKKQKFGASSEKIQREIEQLELALEGLEIAQAEKNTAPAQDGAQIGALRSGAEEQGANKIPRRRPRVCESTPRERKELNPGETCDECGGALRLVSEDVSEILELVAAKLKVIEVARLKKSCRCCEKMVQAPAPSRPIPGSMAGPSLLAFILVSKFDDHIPLYRLNEIFERMGADIPDSTLADWCGRSMRTLAPLNDLIIKAVMATDRLHADDTPIRVLDRTRRSAGFGKNVKEGRIWTYVRDDRPWAGPAPPGVVYYFSPDRKGEHPQNHLKGFKGILQADAYAGFKELYKADVNGNVQVREAACWAHLRRDFHDVWKTTKSEIARQALDRIGSLYDIEKQINGRSAEERRAVRQAHSKPKVESFKVWAEQQLGAISGKSDLAKAFRYILSRWAAFTLFLEDGCVAIDNNAAERAMRPIGIGRKNWLFAGSDSGGETLAKAMTIIETAKLSGRDPQAYLADVLARINDHMNNRLHELLPWNWKPLEAVTGHQKAA
jgi:transposase